MQVRRDAASGVTCIHPVSTAPSSRVAPAWTRLDSGPETPRKVASFWSRLYVLGIIRFSVTPEAAGSSPVHPARITKETGVYPRLRFSWIQPVSTATGAQVYLERLSRLRGDRRAGDCSGAVIRPEDCGRHLLAAARSRGQTARPCRRRARRRVACDRLRGAISRCAVLRGPRARCGRVRRCACSAPAFRPGRSLRSRGSRPRRRGAGSSACCVSDPLYRLPGFRRRR